MSRHRIRKVRGKPPSRPAADRPRPVPQTPTNRSDCRFALSPQFLGPYTVRKNSRSSARHPAQYRVVSGVFLPIIRLRRGHIV